MTEALFDLDPEANLIPRLAESWEQTDETTYVIKLRQGVKFHDGNPFDAEVVKFNLERMLNPETQNVWASEIAQLESVEVIDTHTVQLKTKALLAAFLIPLYDMNGMQLSPAAVKSGERTSVSTRSALAPSSSSSSSRTSTSFWSAIPTTGRRASRISTSSPSGRFRSTPRG